jgi:hypothetical protein
MPWSMHGLDSHPVLRLFLYVPPSVWGNYPFKLANLDFKSLLYNEATSPRGKFMSNRHIKTTLFFLLLILSAFAPRFATALLGGRSYDESHDLGYIDWAGSVGYANITHRDSICPATCWDTVTQISGGSQVSGAFDRDVTSFDVLVAMVPGQGYGTATLTACSATDSRNLNAETGSTPGYTKFFLTVPAGCRDWSLSASGGVVYFAAVDVAYSAVILPPVISGALNCSQPGSKVMAGASARSAST